MLAEARARGAEPATIKLAEMDQAGVKVIRLSNEEISSLRGRMVALSCGIFMAI